MSRVKYLKYSGRILPFMFDYSMTTEEIERWLSSNKEYLFPHLDLCEPHSCVVYSVTENFISVSGDEDSLSLEIDYTQVINKDWT